MRDLLTVDDRGHPVLHVTAFLLRLVRDGLHADVTDADLAPVLPLAEPAFPGLHVIEGLAPDTSDAAALVFALLEDRLLHDDIGQVLRDDRLRMEAPFLLPDLLQGGRGEREADRLPALQHLLRDGALIVLPDDAVDDIEPFLDGDVLQRSGSEDGHLVFPQVIDEVTVDGGGFHGKGTGPLVHDDAVAGEDLVPLLPGEIDVGGDEFGIGPGLLSGRGTRLDLGNDGPELLQNVLTGSGGPCLLDGLASLVVETVTSILEFTRFDPAVGPVRDQRSAAVTQLAADTPQVVSFLLPGSPAEQAPPCPEVNERTDGPAVLALADPVAVKAHGDPSVGVPGVDIILRQMEVRSHHRREGIVGLAV